MYRDLFKGVFKDVFKRREMEASDEPLQNLLFQAPERFAYLNLGMTSCSVIIDQFNDKLYKLLQNWRKLETLKFGSNVEAQFGPKSLSSYIQSTL